MELHRALVRFFNVGRGIYLESGENCEKYFTKTTKKWWIHWELWKYFTKNYKNVEFTHWSVEKRGIYLESSESLCGNQGNLWNFLQNVSKFKESTHILKKILEVILQHIMSQNFSKYL